jgi:hypothetical protein
MAGSRIWFTISDAFSLMVTLTRVKKGRTLDADGGGERKSLDRDAQRR